MRELFWKSWPLRDLGEPLVTGLERPSHPQPGQCFLDGCPPLWEALLWGATPSPLVILAQGCTLTPTVALGGSGTLAPFTEHPPRTPLFRRLVIEGVSCRRTRNFQPRPAGGAVLQGPMGAPGWDSGDKRLCGHEKKALLGPTARVCTLGDVNCWGEWRSLCFPRAQQMAVLQRQTGPPRGHAPSIEARASQPHPGSQGPGCDAECVCRWPGAFRLCWDQGLRQS